MMMPNDEVSNRKRKREESRSGVGSEHWSGSSTSVATTSMTTPDIASDDEQRVAAEYTVLPNSVGETVWMAPEPHITFFVGSEIRQVPQSKFLSYVWWDGLDSKCMVCDKQFVLGVAAPIRTIGFEYLETLEPPIYDITQSAIAPHPIRIYNRHLDCIKSAKSTTYPSHMHGMKSLRKPKTTEWRTHVQLG
jgi:hypothetical protein